jgi:2-oxoisovalerate dehydrogenase E1 component
VQAAGMYNTLLAADEPALVVECLNGYRVKEALPQNLGEFRTPIGVAECVREGVDLTVVSYGSTFNLCVVAAERLAEMGVELELIDVRTLLPFDLTGVIGQSVEKTSRVLFVDEDVPGGATAYMLEQAMGQGLWKDLDTEPQTLAAAPHLPPFGTDGDYFAKPSVEDIVERAYALVAESRPGQFPPLL